MPRSGFTHVLPSALSALHVMVVGERIGRLRLVGTPFDHPGEGRNVVRDAGGQFGVLGFGCRAGPVRFVWHRLTVAPPACPTSPPIPRCVRALSGCSSRIQNSLASRFPQFGQLREGPNAVRIRPEDLTSFATACGDVVDRAGILGSQRPARTSPYFPELQTPRPRILPLPQ